MKEPPEYDAQKNVIEDDKFFRFGNSHPTRTWQEEFNERFGFYCGKPKNETMTPNNVRAFISSLLSRQESELRKKIEGMIYSRPHTHSNEDCEACTHDSALQQVLKLLHT